MNKFGITMETKVNLLGAVCEYNDVGHDTLYLIFEKDQVPYILEFMQQEEDTEIRNLTNTSYGCINLEQKQLERNQEYQYLYFVLDGEETLEKFLETFYYLFAETVEKEVFLTHMGYIDLEDTWNTLFTRMRNSGQTIETMKDLLEGYI